MKRWLYVTCITLLFLASRSFATDYLDVRRGVPDDVYLVVYGRHNPERADQYRHYAEVWKTVREIHLFDHLFEVVTAGVAAERREQSRGIKERLSEAVAPVDVPALIEAKEVIYARSVQMSPVPFFHHLVLLRAAPEVIASTAAGMKNLFAVAEDYTDGKFAKFVESTEGEAKVYSLVLPDHLPLQPSFAQLGDLLVFSTSKDRLRKSLSMLVSGTGPSKFDDPRLAAALRQLPEMEDYLVFNDGKTRLDSLRGFGPFVQAVSDGDPGVERFVRILDKVWDEAAIFDYEVTVGYTEGNLDRSVSYGKLLPNTGDASFRQVMFGAPPFEKWYAWVPADALSCSLGHGPNLHPLYEWIMAILKEDVPESAELLSRFEAIQEQIDVHLDADILQAFSGQYVLTSVPAQSSGQSDFVFALRCAKPERIRELIHRAVAAAQEVNVPLVQWLQLHLDECKELAGFEELSAVFLAVLQLRPVIGFQDEWLYFGTTSGAVQKVFDTKAGKGATIEGTEAFQRLGLDVTEPVISIAYSNSAEKVRHAAMVLDRVGPTMSLLMGMLGTHAKQVEDWPVSEAFSLFPEVAQIVRKLDFLEASAAVQQAGTEPDTYLRRSVTIVRPFTEATAEK